MRHIGRFGGRSQCCPLLWSCSQCASSASAQMPDPRQMSGIPRPVDDLPNGSVSVRVIRGDMSHNLQNQPVEMRAGNTTRTVNTDAQGRAQFDNIDAGTPVKFSTVVDGERLESQEFAIPATRRRPPAAGCDRPERRKGAGRAGERAGQSAARS